MNDVVRSPRVAPWVRVLAIVWCLLVGLVAWTAAKARAGSLPWPGLLDAVPFVGLTVLFGVVAWTGRVPVALFPIGAWTWPAGRAANRPVLRAFRIRLRDRRRRPRA